MNRKAAMEMEKLGETLLYIVFALAAIGVIVFFLKGCQDKQDQLTGKKILCPLNPEACKQNEQDQAAAQTGGVNPPDLKESFEKCYNEKKLDCPEGLQALSQSVLRLPHVKYIEIQNDLEKASAQVIIPGEEKTDTLSFNFLISSCDKDDVFYSIGEIRMQPSPQKEININFAMGDTYQTDWWHTATGVGYQAQNVQRLCIYYKAHKLSDGPWW